MDLNFHWFSFLSFDCKSFGISIIWHWPPKTRTKPFVYSFMQKELILFATWEGLRCAVSILQATFAFTFLLSWNFTELWNRTSQETVFLLFSCELIVRPQTTELLVLAGNTVLARQVNVKSKRCILKSETATRTLHLDHFGHADRSASAWYWGHDYAHFLCESNLTR